MEIDIPGNVTFAFKKCSNHWKWHDFKRLDIGIFCDTYSLCCGRKERAYMSIPNLTTNYTSSVVQGVT